VVEADSRRDVLAPVIRVETQIRLTAVTDRQPAQRLMTQLVYVIVYVVVDVTVYVMAVVVVAGRPAGAPQSTAGVNQCSVVTGRCLTEVRAYSRLTHAHTSAVIICSTATASQAYFLEWVAKFYL